MEPFGFIGSVDTRNGWVWAPGLQVGMLMSVHNPNCIQAGTSVRSRRV